MKKFFENFFKDMYSDRYLLLLLTIGYLLFSIYKRDSFMTYIANVIGIFGGIVIYQFIQTTIKITSKAYMKKAIEKRRIKNAKLKEARQSRYKK